ncbi:MAG: cobyric acid synthase, partial [Methermicoccaceae archaeon]
VVVQGKPYADVSAGEYYLSVDKMMEFVLDSVERLSSHEVMVIEGAGGAAEINLFERDIANIGMARAVKPSIILVGDIERGGVFASLYGTWRLLPEDIRPLVKGFIINKLKGDPSLLGDGPRRIEELTGMRYLGTLPYARLDIPSEDSVSIDDKTVLGSHMDVDIAVIRLPRISNFTDFEPLERAARVRYVERAEGLGDPDVIIIPGTKNTVDDLHWLWESGMAERIVRAREGGIPVIGICGGYQMLGREIVDSGIEGREGIHRGLGLLDVSTVFDRYEKHTVQVKKLITGGGPILERVRGKTITGYEIHMGKTDSKSAPFFDDGSMSEDGLVIGTYLHGLFDNACMKEALLRYVCEKKGVAYTDAPIEDDPFDALARFFEEHIDMNKVYNMISHDG